MLEPAAPGPLCSLLHILMGHEKRCADEFQQTCTLAGLVEADGTSIRSFKQGSALVYRQLYGMIARKDVKAWGQHVGCCFMVSPPLDVVLIALRLKAF